MSTANLVKLVFALLLLVGAGFGFFRFLRRDTAISEQTYFYDLSAKKLFAAPRDALPPIRGLDDATEDAVRAVVICPPGKPEDRTIAYLEKYAPELRQNLEQVRAGKAEPLPSKVRNGYRFVQRPGDERWQPANSAAGEQILNGWNTVGQDGRYPVVCSP